MNDSLGVPPQAGSGSTPAAAIPNAASPAPAPAPEHDTEDEQRWPNAVTPAPAVGADALPALRKLVEQIDKAEFVDENGHPIKMNVAYLAAKELL